MLGAIVIPTRASELPLVERNFRLWSHDAFWPTASGQPRCRLVVLFNNEGAQSVEPEVRAAFDEFGMCRFFSGPEFVYLDLVGDRDLYSRRPTDRVGTEGAKAGPNNQFFDGMTRCRDYGPFIFYMETDCVPIRRGWLDRIAQEAEAANGTWVIGSIYRGVECLPAVNARHINGNALYAAGDAAFQDFLSRWRSYTLAAIAAGQTTLAYDYAIEQLFASNMAQMQRYAHRFRLSDFIQNLSAPADEWTPDDDQVRRILAECPGTTILHGRRFSLAVDALLADGGPLVPERLTPVVIAPHPPPSLLVRLKRCSIRSLEGLTKWLVATEFRNLWRRT